MKKIKLICLSLLFCVSISVHATEYGKVSSQKVAENVYLFRTNPYGDVGMSGNSVAIITDQYVLMFDTNAIPETAKLILDEVRKLTGKPVRYIVNSHWHWDHWGGNEIYQASFPNVQIISHFKTREQLMTVEPRWNDEGLKTGLPAYLNDLAKTIDEEKAKQSDPDKIKKMEERLVANRHFLNQKTSLKKILPNFTFSEKLTLDPASGQIQILHATAITVGDAYLYLPQQKILVTGDIMLSPYPYAIGGTFPSAWLETLEKFKELSPALIIPGHGDVQKPVFIQSHIQLFQKSLRLVKEAKGKNLTLDQTKEFIGKQSQELLLLLGISDPATTAEFKAYFLNVFTQRAFKELDGPLSELPDGLKQ